MGEELLPIAHNDLSLLGTEDHLILKHLKELIPDIWI